MKKLFFFVTFCILNFSIISQTPSVVQHIRFPVWANVDAFPGWELNDDGQNGDESYPVKSIKELGPFLMKGMVDGWKFIYVPADKARGVEEYFELIEINPEVEIANRIVYSSPWVEDNKLHCWVDFQRSDIEVSSYNLWSSIRNPVIRGRGYGPLEDGFNGIKKAVEEAVKDAIREHYRSKYKNKPKEITGSVLMRKTPLLGIDQGRYVINLDFFLEYGRIKQYTHF